MPFSNCVGHLELSIWDLLGKTVKQPVARFFDRPVRSEVPMYLSSLTRDNSAEQEIGWLQEQLEVTGAKAIKLKVGGRMTGEEKVPGGSKKIIELARKTFGSAVTILCRCKRIIHGKRGNQCWKDVKGKRCGYIRRIMCLGR